MSSPLYTTSMPPPPSFSKTRLMGYGLTTHRKEPAFASHLRPRPQASQREGDYTRKFMGGDWKHYFGGFSSACLARMALARASILSASASRFNLCNRAA